MSEDALLLPLIEPEVGERYRCLAGFLSIEAAALYELLFICGREDAGQALTRLNELVACDIRDLRDKISDLDLVLRELAEIEHGVLDDACVSGGAPADLDAAVRFYGARLRDLTARIRL